MRPNNKFGYGSVSSMPTFRSTPVAATFRGQACTVRSWWVGRCAVHLWLMRDEPEAFIGGGDHWDGSAREADADELEALAERFHSEELRVAAARVRAAGAEPDAAPGRGGLTTS